MEQYCISQGQIIVFKPENQSDRYVGTHHITKTNVINIRIQNKGQGPVKWTLYDPEITMYDDGIVAAGETVTRTFRGVIPEHWYKFELSRVPHDTTDWRDIDAIAEITSDQLPGQIPAGQILVFNPTDRSDLYIGTHYQTKTRVINILIKNMGQGPVKWILDGAKIFKSGIVAAGETINPIFSGVTPGLWYTFELSRVPLDTTDWRDIHAIAEITP